MPPPARSPTAPPVRHNIESAINSPTTFLPIGPLKLLSSNSSSGTLQPSPHKRSPRPLRLPPQERRNIQLVLSCRHRNMHRRRLAVPSIPNKRWNPRLRPPLQLRLRRFSGGLFASAAGRNHRRTPTPAREPTPAQRPSPPPSPRQVHSEIVSAGTSSTSPCSTITGPLTEEVMRRTPTQAP